MMLNLPILRRPLLRRALPGAFILFVPGMAFAQVSQPCVNDRHYDSTMSPLVVESLCDGLLLSHPNLPAGASSRPAIADFNGDLRPDAFMAIAGHPVLSVGPGVIDLNYPMTLPSQSFWMTSVAALEFDDGLFPMMVASTDTGIQTWKLDGVTGVPMPTFVVAPSWSFASELLTADVDGDGSEELVGFFERGLTTTEIRVGRLSRAGQLTEIAALTLQIPMPSAHTLEWDTSRPGEEIAVVFQQRAYLLSDQLALVEAHYLSQLSICSAAIRDHIGPGLAVVTRTGATDSLVVLRPGIVESPVSLGTLGTTTVSAGDHVAYDLGDLVLVGTNGVCSLPNRSRFSSATFDGTIEQVYERLGGGPDAMQPFEPWIVTQDLDNDLDADLLLHDSENQSTVVVLATTRSEGNLAPKIEFNHIPLTEVSPSPGSTETITLELHNVVWRQLTNTTHFDVEAWDPHGGVDVSYSRVPLSSITNNVVLAPIQVDINGVSYGQTSMVLVRPVTVHPVTGEVTEVGPDLRLKVPLGNGSSESVGPVPSSTDPDPPSRNAGGGGPPTSGGGG